jgi:hypothetical protein
VKSNLPIVKRGDPMRIVVGVDFPIREIEEPFRVLQAMKKERFCEHANLPTYEL